MDKLSNRYKGLILYKKRLQKRGFKIVKLRQFMIAGVWKDEVRMDKYFCLIFYTSTISLWYKNKS